MNIDYLFNEIENQTYFFEPISLKEMDNVKLMDRVDVKYVIPIHLLPKILADARASYRILEVENKRLCSYKTLYYDTLDFQLYTSHLLGRANRYKIRARNYEDSDLNFFEIKFKNNKGRTIKTRICREGIEHRLDLVSATFLKNSTSLVPDSLSGVMWVDYRRITLVNRHTPERLTIDLKLTFRNDSAKRSYPEIAIAEVKQEKITGSSFINIMKAYNLRQGSISKYCFGIISLFEDIKHNSFKPHLQKINKLINQYDSSARNSYTRAISVV